MVIFVFEFAIFLNISEWNELEENGFRFGGISKISFLDHFSPSFIGQNLVFLDTYSILRVKTMYESVK